MSNNGTNNNIFKYFVAVGMLIGISILVFFIFKNMNKSSGDSGGSGSSGSLYDVDSIKAIAQKVFDDKMVGISINNGVITANAIKVTTVDTEWILIDRSGISEVMLQQMMQHLLLLHIMTTNLMVLMVLLLVVLVLSLLNPSSKLIILHVINFY